MVHHRPLQTNPDVSYLVYMYAGRCRRSRCVCLHTWRAANSCGHVDVHSNVWHRAKGTVKPHTR